MADDHEPPSPPVTTNPLVPTPIIGRNAPSPERPPLPPDIEEQFNHLMQTVQALSAHFLGESAAPAGGDGAKERGGRRIRKFHRASGATPVDEAASEAPAEGPGDPPEDAADEAGGFARNREIAWPRAAAADAARFPIPGALPWWPLAPEWRWRLGLGALGFALLGLGFLLGHSAAPPVAKSGKARRRPAALFEPSELTEQAFLTANEALHDEHTGNVDAARKVYEAALTKRVDLPGINYRLALLAIQRNDRLEAEQRLERSTLEGEAVAESCYLLARIAADQGDLDEQAAECQRATRERPFDGRYFFYYAEVLRRQGTPRAAITAFEQALDRPYPAATGDLYLFKERLAKIEYGRDDNINGEIAAHLKQEPVEGDWLLLAAAQDLDRQAFAAAADHLRQAANRLPTGIYADLTHDFLFQAHARRPELAGLLNRTATPVLSSAGPTVLDPATWAPERADPATWPAPGARSSR